MTDNRRLARLRSCAQKETPAGGPGEIREGAKDRATSILRIFRRICRDFAVILVIVFLLLPAASWWADAVSRMGGR